MPTGDKIDRGGPMDWTWSDDNTSSPKWPRDWTDSTDQNPFVPIKPDKSDKDMTDLYDFIKQAQNRDPKVTELEGELAKRDTIIKQLTKELEDYRRILSE